MDELDDSAREPEPWTVEEYERVRLSVVAAVRKMMPISAEHGVFYAGIPGPLYWDVLSALDREREPRPGPGRPLGPGAPRP